MSLPNSHRNILKKVFSAVILAGIFAIPIGAGAATSSTTISSVVSPVIGLFTTSGTVNIDVAPSGAGVQTIASDTVSVSTNDPSGYTLKLGETGVSTNLVSGSDTIPASAGTQATPIAAAVNTWGYRVDSIGGFGAGPTLAASNAAVSGSIKFAGVAAAGSPNTIKTTAAVATSDTTTVWYGVALDTSTPSGTYTNSVTYTAVAN